MNRDRAKKLLPIMQAFAEGKDIQYHDHKDGWVTDDPEFHEDLEYRIKPEPEVIYFNKKKLGERFSYGYHNEIRARMDAQAGYDYEYIAKKFIAADE